MTDLLFPPLEPRPVWDHFATLCAIPRHSKQEAGVRAHLLVWARECGLESEVDAAGNLILRKPASPGCEGRPGLVLQGHLDMVCQQNAGTRHDFQRDPIRPVVRDGWLVAEHTTLGADNGIGVALALAALEDADLVHPPLEVLLTVDEEAGMGGARRLEPDTLRGRYLINLDTEEWGEFTLGCAGGMDVEAHRACAREPALESIPAGHVVWRLSLAGLLGGHSGIDIHRGRGNAIKLLVEGLRELAARLDARLISLEGGNARNAIPREAFAHIALPAAAAERLPALLGELLARWQPLLAGIDDGLVLTGQPVEDGNEHVLTPTDQDSVLDFLDSAANGVARMSDEFPGVVETSDNLGVFKLEGETCRAVFMVRSLRDSEAARLAEQLIRHAEQRGFQAHKIGPYPGWAPNPASRLLALGQRAYAREFGQPARLQVIHAGLECGLLAASHPSLDLLSFGPDIRGAHAPGERVEIASVARCWVLLKAVLKELATDG
jgi:dipeptidase D